MATEVQKFTQAAGYKPLEDRCIIVKYAPENLSEQITAFFNSEFYVLQMCEHEIILLPFNTTWGNLRKDVSLVLPYGDIQWVEHHPSDHPAGRAERSAEFRHLRQHLFRFLQKLAQGKPGWHTEGAD